MMCQSRLLQAQYSIEVSPEGMVLSSTRVTSYSTDSSNPSLAPHSSTLYATLSDLIVQPALLPQIHNDSFARSWMPYLVAALEHSSGSLDPSQPLPSAEALAYTINDLYSRLCANLFALNQEAFFSPSSDEMTPATLVIATTRVYMSPVMFNICIVLLSLHAVVATLFYIHRPKKILRSMPTAVASVLALFDGSSLVDYGGRWDPEWRFGYGRFNGTDGKPKIGIEKHPFVQPLLKAPSVMTRSKPAEDALGSKALKQCDKKILPGL